MHRLCNYLSILSIVLSLVVASATADERSDYIRAHYTKLEVRIPMRDGKRLFTSIYVPNDLDPRASYPILLSRTPYSVGPYGIDKYKPAIGPSVEFEKSRYIFAFQDVRGRYMSEGEFVNMRPHIDNKRGTQIDESSDTYDTIEWLVKNIPRNNSRVGMYGISYPGFYTSAGSIDSHPALVAVSPQAPIADWFFDDFHRNGAFVLPMGFGFFSGFGQPRPEPTPIGAKAIEPKTRDGYKFFLELGPLSNVDRNFFHDEIEFWNDIESHPNYDAFWQARNLLPHLKNVGCAVLTVGGWYDTEDLYGPLATYAAIEKQNPNTENRLIMGPWYHGAWARDEARKLGTADFGFATGTWYREQVQFPFFEYHLKQNGALGLAEATVFETGANRWRQFDQWPPREAKQQTAYIAPGGTLSSDPPTTSGGDDFISDPKKPVPYTQEITTRWAREYVTEDQRFAAWRPDVLVYRGPELKDPHTIAGPIDVDIWVTSTSSDADWVVKVVDEYPGEPTDGSKYSELPGEPILSGRQELVRAGVLRGRFRESFANPLPMKPGEPTRVRFSLSDIMHTFRPGHRVMIQIQSTWFPFIDRNPQKYVPNIFQAKEEDFVTATHRVLYSKEHPSRVTFSTLTEP